MGKQSFTLVIRRQGDGFTGSTEGAMGAVAISDGTVAGDRMVWTMRVTTPLPLTLDCAATVTGDRIEGTVRAGLFGSYAVTGTREA